MNDTLIFLVLAGLALVFKWLTKQSSSDGEKPEPPRPNEQTPSGPLPESDEERVRRFLEALGVPPGTAPPTPVRPRRVVTPAPRSQTPKVTRSWVQPLPPLVTTPQEILRPPLPSEPIPEVVEKVAEVVAPPPPALLPILSKPAPRRAAPVTSLGTLLRSRASIRQAIILREVLGPPRGLQALGEFHGP